MIDVQLAKFMLVGVANTAVGLSVILGAKWWGGLGDVAANLLGYGVGLAVSFAVNKAWTFRFSGEVGVALVRFLLIFVVAYAANLVTVLLFVRVMRFDSYWAQPIGIIPYTLILYLGSRYFVFSTNRNRPVRDCRRRSSG